MPEDLAETLAVNPRGYVIAPAGCGKTHLIAQAVTHCDGRQLILTHTHAGVRAILNHLRRQQVPQSQYRVTTIDGFALKYASAFPMLADWHNQKPREDQWSLVPEAAIRALQRPAVKGVVEASYAGVFVDEYQDCTLPQHALVTALAKILPCRVLGDPLQAIFWSINKDQSLSWEAVEKHFAKVGELTTPHRWLGRNGELGDWLIEVRKQLIHGTPIDLRAGPVKWVRSVDEPAQLATCKSALSRKSESVVAIRQWRPQCHSLAKKLNNAFSSMEDVECKDLLAWAARFDAAHGDKRVHEVVAFAQKWLARLPSAVGTIADALLAGRAPKPTKNDRLGVLRALEKIRTNDDFLLVDDALASMERLEEKPVFASREIWLEMRKALRNARSTESVSLADAAWKVRDSSRRLGRFVPNRCLSTTLLVKGLEFDHVLVLKADDFGDAENLYVALTRGAKSLVIHSTNPVLQRAPPQFTV